MGTIMSIILYICIGFAVAWKRHQYYEELLVTPTDKALFYIGGILLTPLCIVALFIEYCGHRADVAAYDKEFLASHKIKL